MGDGGVRVWRVEVVDGGGGGLGEGVTGERGGWCGVVCCASKPRSSGLVMEVEGLGCWNML